MSPYEEVLILGETLCHGAERANQTSPCRVARLNGESRLDAIDRQKTVPVHRDSGSWFSNDCLEENLMIATTSNRPDVPAFERQRASFFVEAERDNITDF
jgi:hypothetical protein